MRNVLLAVGFAMVLCGTAQAAQEAPSACEAPQAWVQRIEQENPSIQTARVETMPDHIIQALVEHYNQLPPVEKQIAADAAVIIVGKGNGKGAPALIGLFLKGCVVGSFPIMVPEKAEQGA